MIPSFFARRTPAAQRDRVRHIFSVDVEEYFHVSAFESIIAATDWSFYPSRVERCVHALLALLAQHEARATFFCLGWVADRHPWMIRQIVGAGHEIASHGWSHRRVTTLTPEAFRIDVRRSKDILERISRTQVLGFRAPSFSIVPGGEWALDVLLEEGYRYDSSLFPVRRRGYGYPGGQPLRHEIPRAGGTLVELPPATLNVAGVRVPAGGGGYLRQFPLAVIRAAIRQHERLGVPAMLYVHPWEIDPEQPRLPVDRVTRIRHYRGLERTASRLAALFSEFAFTNASACLPANDADTAVAALATTR